MYRLTQNSTPKAHPAKSILRLFLDAFSVLFTPPPADYQAVTHFIIDKRDTKYCVSTVLFANKYKGLVPLFGRGKSFYIIN